MKILIVNNTLIPAKLYGGTERVIWGLGKELTAMGHDVSFLVKPGSSCDFAKLIFIDESRDLAEQIPGDFDLVHFHFNPRNLESLKNKYIITIHGNSNVQEPFSKNVVFVSKDHANRYGSDSFVHNGLDWSEYDKPELNIKRKHFHFLGKAAWRVKNVQGAIDVIKGTPSEKLMVMGGKRFNISMGIRFTFSPRIKFFGMVNGTQKFSLLNNSKGLIFPVKWHEPFGLAIIESLYYGCPVFGTPYGSLPELVLPEFGYLSCKQAELTKAVINWETYSKQQCYEYANDVFNSKKMALEYLKKYETVLSGKNLNSSPPVLKKVQQEKFLEWNS